MRYCRRCLSLLFACVLSFVLFSVVAAADEDLVFVDAMYYASTSSYSDLKKLYSQDLVEGASISDAFSFLSLSYQPNYFWQEFSLKPNDGKVLFKADRPGTVTLSNFYIYLDNDNYIHYLTSVNEVSISLYYTDGSGNKYYFDANKYFGSSDSLKSSVEIPIDPVKDVSYATIALYYDTTNFGLEMFTSITDYYFVMGAENFQCEIDIETKEQGLLGGILEGITSLPGKIWEFIENGLKSLFVPDEEYMSGYSDKWDELLSDRLGAVYQVCDIVVSSWDQIVDADATNLVEMPEVTIPLGKDSFTFGGYSVQIVPDGFDVLVDAIKLIVGILCSIAFINGLLKRYDEVMGVEQ